MKVFPLLVCLSLSALAQDEAPGLRTADPVEARIRIAAIQRAIDATVSLPLKLREEARRMERDLNQIEAITGHADNAASPAQGTTSDAAGGPPTPGRPPDWKGEK